MILSRKFAIASFASNNIPIFITFICKWIFFSFDWQRIVVIIKWNVLFSNPRYINFYSIVFTCFFDISLKTLVERFKIVKKEWPKSLKKSESPIKSLNLFVKLFAIIYDFLSLFLNYYDTSSVKIINKNELLFLFDCWLLKFNLVSLRFYYTVRRLLWKVVAIFLLWNFSIILLILTIF